ncbi:MAG: hypothetical protein IKM23_02345 [Bacteroidales bacterium]|nr:hypothetical protein [Bacteroidales bacterium]
MRKIAFLFSVIIVLTSVNVANAQSKDVLGQSKKNKGGWNSQNEEVITKKKKQNQVITNSDFEAVEDNVPQEMGPVVLNSCEEDMTVEFVSLVGAKASQTINLTIKYTNHNVNSTMKVRAFKAFNEEGDNFTDSYPVSDKDAITDVPIKLKWEVGKMLPSKNSKLTVLTFEINGCVVEMRNVPIEWR